LSPKKLRKPRPQPNQKKNLLSHQIPQLTQKKKKSAEKPDTKKSAPPHGGAKKKILVARKKSDDGKFKDLSPQAISERARVYSERKKHSGKDSAREIKSAEIFDGEEEHLNKLSDKIIHTNSEDEYANVPGRIEIPEVISIKNLAQKLNLKAVQVIKKFFSLGVMDLTVNDSIDSESAVILCNELNCTVKVVSLLEQTKVEEESGDESDYIPRDPIVTIMGHVDHGKTTLIDSLRKSNITASESGGITQHISAYKITNSHGAALFIDTPGHAAFSAMRSRGAEVTDIIVLIISAVDGVMPQTAEVIDIAKKSGAVIIAAVNKIDLPGADIEKIKKQLAEKHILTEEWGGDTVLLPISALKGEGINELLESIHLQAEVLGIKGNPKIRASGFVLESKIEQGKGTVITVVIKNGTLHTGDAYIVGNFTGRVRAMFDEYGKTLKQCPPSGAVELIGVSGTPVAGDKFVVLTSEKEAKQLAERRIQLVKENAAQNVKKVTLTNLFDTMKAQQIKELKVFIRGDVFGSVEAVKEMLSRLKNDEVRVNIIGSGIGHITESDIRSCATSGAIAIGFRVKPNGEARRLAERENVSIRLYQVIYDIVDDITEMLESMLTQDVTEEKSGTAEIKTIFKISGTGKIAGCLVIEGKIYNTNKLRIKRNQEIIHEGKVAALKHYKDDVKEVAGGSECGIQIDGFEDMQAGDLIECYSENRVSRKLQIN